MNTSHHPTRRTARGLTLIELTIVLAVLSVLLAGAAPLLTALVDSMRMRTIANDFLTSLYLTRSEAIKRNGRAAMCKSADGINCASTGGWHQGWIVFHDDDNSGTVAPGERVIHRVQGLPSHMRVSGNQMVSRYISFTPVGGTRTLNGAFQAGTITVCNDRTPGSEGREIVLNNVGRMRVNKTLVSVCL